MISKDKEFEITNEFANKSRKSESDVEAANKQANEGAATAEQERIAADKATGEAAKKAAEDASAAALKELNTTQTNKQKEIDELKTKLE